MNNQQAVVDQIVQNLAFEVEAVPKNELIQTTSMSQSTPLNVKIKVRKKDEIYTRPDVSSIADSTSRTVQKVRLVNSDRTIMTFDVFMEAEFEKKPSRKLRKHIFDMLRPGICLGAVDDDKCPYTPSSSYTANITKPSVVTKSDGTLKQTFTLSKNAYQDYSVSTQPGEQKWLFGTCKPGGCLDPPFGEDKYSYKPSTRSGPERQGEERLEAEDIESDANKNKKPITLHDEESQSYGRQSSIFDSGLFKKKRKSSDKSTNTKLTDKTDSIVDIFQGESATNSESTHSNPIITYPPKTKSDPKISDDKTVRSRGPSEDRPRKSFNDHSEPYFTRPKGVQRIKEKDKSDPNDQPKPRSADAADLKKLPKESFKMPIPIPIPVPIPTISSKRKPEDIATNNDIDVIKQEPISELKLQDQELHDQEPQSEDQELHGTINLKDTVILPRILRTKSASGDTDDKPVESPKTSILVPFSDEKPTAPNELDTMGSSISIEDQSSNRTKLQPLNAKETDNNIEDSAQAQFLKIPVAVPFSLDTHFEGSKGMQQIIKPALEKKESFTDAIPANFLTRGGFSDQGNDTEIPVTLDPIMEKDIKQDSEREINTGGIEKLAGETDAKEKASTSTNYTEEDMARDFKGEEITDDIGKSLGQMYTQEVKKHDSHGEKITDGIEKPAKPSETKETTEENIQQDSKEDELTDEIEKQTEQEDTQDIHINNEYTSTKTPTELKNIKDTATIPRKYLDENDIKRDYEAEAITNGIVKPANQEAIKENDIGGKATSATKYEKNISDIYGMPDIVDIQQIKGTPKEDDHKDSEIISASKLKRSDSPDKYWNDIGHGVTDLDIHIDKKRSSLLSEPENETDTWDKKNKPYSNKEYVDETTKSNFIAAPVIIDKTEGTSIFGPIKEVYRDTDLVSQPMDPVVGPLITQIASGFKKFGDYENVQSLKYEAEESDPSTSTKKQVETIPSSDKRIILPGDTVISSVQSASTIKSAMKKDTMSIDFGFHSYLNDKNERIVETFDSANAPKRLPGDSITVINSQIRISSEIRIPVDSEHDMSIQIKKVNSNRRVSLSESGLVNAIDHGRLKKQGSPVQCSDAETRSSEVKAEGRKDNIHESDTTADRFLDYYEQELVPLQLTIKNLRDEIDFLATQQTIFKDKLYCSNKSKLPRLVHSNKKCFGCVRK